MGTGPATKKEHIVELATSDPFMQIAEIAAAADTTPRYVRTILSEARLSLSQLRRDYARMMERRLKVRVELPHATQGLAGVLARTGAKTALCHPRVSHIVDCAVSKALLLSPGEPLLCVSRSRSVDGSPFFLSQVITPNHIVLGEGFLTSDQPLRRILGLEVPGETQFVDRSLEVVKADNCTAESLALREGSPVLKCGNVIVTRGKRVGIEFNYFDAFRVRLFVESGDYSLKIVEKEDG